jgi:GNAT superfamily N-acetyltransferase
VDIDSHRTAYRHIFGEDYLKHRSEDALVDWWIRALSRETDGAPEAVLVAVDGREIVGYAGLIASRDGDAFGGRIGEVASLYVHPSRWRQGVGARRLATVRAWFESRGFAEATLWVLEENQQGRAFYEKQGWRLDGARQLGERDSGVPAHYELRYRTPVVAARV